MNYSALKQQTLELNQDLTRSGLVVLTFGNASIVDRAAGVMAIKPSGVAYEDLTADAIIISSLKSGEIVEGRGRPSSDLPTHLHLYQQFTVIGAIVHTHSVQATSWAQAGKSIPCLGTTHADHFFGPIPVTRHLRKSEITSDYELNTGRVIVEHFKKARLNPAEMPAVLVRGHAPFVWGATAATALENAIALETIAQMAAVSLSLNPRLKPLPQPLLTKHFRRKHGPTSYYGQP